MNFLERKLRGNAEAEPLCQRALAIREKALGPEHPDVATSLEDYADLLRKTGRDNEAAENGSPRRGHLRQGAVMSDKWQVTSFPIRHR